MNVSQLTAYQSQVFIALTEIVYPEYAEDDALALIEKHATIIAERERRRFEPNATARVITELEAGAQERPKRFQLLKDTLWTGARDFSCVLKVDEVCEYFQHSDTYIFEHRSGFAPYFGARVVLSNPEWFEA